MPTYRFRCDKCDFAHQFSQSIKDDLPVQCPNCRSKKDYHQVYSGGILATCKTVITVGQQAELNEKTMGRTQLQEMVGKEKEKKDNKKKKLLADAGLPATLDEVPFWRAGMDDISKPLDLNKVKDVDKYVETGKTD